MCVDNCTLRLDTLITVYFTHQRDSGNRADLEQLRMKLQSILSIISKYQKNDGLRALDSRVKKLCEYVGLSMSA